MRDLDAEYIKKDRSEERSFSHTFVEVCLDDANVLGFVALAAWADFEFDRLAFFE